MDSFRDRPVRVAAKTLRTEQLNSRDNREFFYYLIFTTMKYQNLLHTIGNTPMIQLFRFLRNKNVNLFAKLEGQNPGGSVKDRVALYLIEQAEKRGELSRGKTIIEATSGNMGIALALVSAQKGYNLKIFMSEGMSNERKIMLRALGAELILTDKSVGTKGAIEQASTLAKSNPDKYWFANQFNNPDNIEAHYHGTAKEILNEVKNIDILIAGIGTSGTLLGISKRFREESPHTKIIAVVPPKGYQIQGIQNPKEDYQGSIFDENLIDEMFHVSVEDAYKTSKLAAQIEGLFVGMSSGASLFAAEKISENLIKANIVVLIPDRGEKYLSTQLFL